MLTYRDTIDALKTHFGGHATMVGEGPLRQSIVLAYQTIAQAHRWQSLNRRHRLVLDAAYSTGTVDYDYTGGTYERQLTLASGTWPTWAASGWVLIDGETYRVDERKSATVLTLDSTFCPVADIAAGTTYSIFRRTYTLPATFLSMNQPIDSAGTWYGYVDPDEFLQYHRVDPSAGEPRVWTILPDEDNPGRSAVYVQPPPSTAEAIDFIGHFAPRALTISGYESASSVGTVACSASTAVTGTTTAFPAGSAGGVIRFSSNTTAPSGHWGANPYAEEALIRSRDSATALTLTAAVTGTYSGAKYVISDPIDLPASMHAAFLRRCELELAILLNMDGIDRRSQIYERALYDAKVADSPVMGRRFVGMASYSPRFLRDWPAGSEA